MNALQFLESVTSLNLIAAPEVTRLRETLGAEQLTAAADAVAREMVEKGLLTRYQAQNIYKGRGKGLLFGEYLVLDKLGAGGMGQVYKAQHRRMKRVVALKVLPPQTTNSDAMVKRFYQEVELAARLAHPNIVTAFDAGEAHGLHYLAMEYVEGRDLSYVLTKQGPLAVEPAMRCVMQAARGLEYAHAQGIIHRDIKPANLLVNRLSVVKILDMGLARLQSTLGAQDDGKGLTEAGQVMGTVDYMAPEQAHDTRSADHRADVYSLGCTMYRLLTDRVPYEGDTLLKKILAHREHPIPSLRAARPEVPYALDQLLQRMLAKDPNERISSMGEVATALERLLAGKTDEQSSLNVTDYIPPLEEGRSFLGGSTVSRTPGSTIGRNSSSGTVGATSSPSSSSPSLPEAVAYVQAMPERRSRLPLLGGVAAVVVAALIAWVFVKRGGGSTDMPLTEVAEAATVAPSKSSAAIATTPEVKSPATPAPVAKSTSTEPEKVASASPPTTPPVKAAEPTAVAAVTSTSSPPVASPPKLIVAEPLTEPVDLLARIDPASDAVGQWTKDGGALVMQKTNKPDDRIVVPYVPPADYDLTVAFEGDLAQNETRIGLTIGGYATVFNFTGRSPVAIMTLDCKEPTQLSMRPILDARPNSSKPTLVCAVRGSRLFVTVNGEPAFDWTGDPKLLLLSQQKATTQPKCLSLGCGGSQGKVRFTKLEISPPTVALPAFKTVDVLAKIDVRRNKVSGNARSEHGDLVILASNETSGTRIAFNTARPTEYVVRAVVERTSGKTELIVGLPVGERRGAMVIDMGNNESWVNGAAKRLRGETLLFPWRLHTIECRVTQREPTLVIDGNAMIGGVAWGKDVSLYTSAEVPDLTAFTLFVPSSAGFRIVSLELAQAGAAGKVKPPRPTDEAVATARAKFQSELTVAESRTASSDLKASTAEALWRKSAETSDDAEQFARLEAAAKLAAQAGDLALACHAATGLARAFDGDVDDFYKAIVTDAVKSAKTPTSRQALVPEVVRQMDRAIALDEIGLAIELHAAATTLSRPASADFAKELKARSLELKFLQSQRLAWQQASTAGGDPALAQRAEGRYLGLARGNWASAVPLLEESSETTLAAIGRGELARARGADELMAQAERWWALFEQSDVPLKYVAMENAFSGYRTAAFAGIDSKSKLLLDQRRQAVVQQRRASGLAFAPRHPIDARRIGDHWYKLYDSNISWKTAAQFCADLGGNLLTIETPQENEAITQWLLTTSTDQRKASWLGCTDDEKEGDWRWLDGSPVARPGAFMNWGTNEPNNIGGNQNFAALEAQIINGRPAGPWDDRPSTASLPFVCEWEQ